MRPNIIRICERADALMLQDETFRDFLQMWSDRFPQEGKLLRIKHLKENIGCTLRQAKDMIDMTCPNQEVWFEIGDTVLFRKTNNYFQWYLKVEDTWVSKGEVHAYLTEKDLFPKKPEVIVICTDRRIRRSINSGVLACQLLYRHRFNEGCYYRVGDEIWILNDQDQFVISTGSDPSTLKTEAISNGPWSVESHIDHYKETHKHKHGL